MSPFLMLDITTLDCQLPVHKAPTQVKRRRQYKYQALAELIRGTSGIPAVDHGLRVSEKQ